VEGLTAEQTPAPGSSAGNGDADGAASGAGRGKILVIRGGAIGDFILTLPVLAALRRQFPQCGLEVIGYPHIAVLAEQGGLVDTARSIESRALAEFFGRGAKLDTGWAAYFGGFALIISYLYDPDQIFQANVQRCSKAQYIAGPHRPNDAGQLHATETFLQPLERLAIFDADPVPRLAIGSQIDSGEDTLTGASHVRRAVALHPGSGSERKNWPEQGWIGLVDWLVSESDWPLLLVGGEAEGGRVERLASRVPAERVRVAVNQPLPLLAEQLAGCHAYVGHDSGISHLAAAVGLPGVLIWGETQQAVWRPRSDRFRVVSSPKGLRAVMVEQVTLALNDLLASEE
jgi:heptosyltransferase-2